MKRLLLCAALIVGCRTGLETINPDGPIPDGGRDDGTARDGGATNSGDSGQTSDSGVADTGTPDGGSDGGTMRTIIPEASLGRVPGATTFYLFNEGSGNQVLDHSAAAGAPIDLTVELPGSTRWISGALEVTGPTIVRNTDSSAKLINACKQSDQMSFELWVETQNAQEVGSRMLSLSRIGEGGPLDVDVSFAAFPGDEGPPAVRTGVNISGSFPSLTASVANLQNLTHYVYTANPGANRHTLYVNGTAAQSGSASGNLDGWRDNHSLGFANAQNLNQPWRGTLHLAAIYCDELTAAEVSQNFGAGANPEL